MVTPYASLKVLFLNVFGVCLFQNLPQLTAEEESRVSGVLAKLAEQVQKRRLMMYQYFKDYDRVG